MKKSEEEKPVEIREVYASNLEIEFARINGLVGEFSYISMDTEFPGVVYKPPFKPYAGQIRPSDQYQILKANVDALNLIQVGLTLSDRDGNLPVLPGSSSRVIWQLNFRDFDVARDLHAPDSIALLRRQGIDFERHQREGIDSFRFAQLASASGLFRNDAVSWVTFQSAYDFGYLVKILTRRALPNTLSEFHLVMRSIFGRRVYDVKHMMRFVNILHGGLDRVAQTLKVGRVVGRCHQAGSDSLLTWHAFQKMRDGFFTGGLEEYAAGVLYGLEPEVAY